MLGMSLLIGMALLLLIRLGYSLASFLMADMLATGGEDLGAMALGGSLVTLLLWVANVIVSLAVLVVAIMAAVMGRGKRSEEHTSELQSRFDLVCRLLLEKKKQNNNKHL